MAWVILRFPDGPYEINPEGVARLVRAYAHASAVEQNSQVEAVPQGSWDQLPDITAVKTDWPVVKRQRDIFANQTWDELNNRFASGMTGKDAIDFLENLVSMRDEYTDSVLQMQRDATKTTMRAIAAHVADGEGKLKAATLIAQTAAETELVLVTGVAVGIIGAPALAGGAIVSAGKAATVAFGLAAGSVMKGVTKWKETDKLGQGLLECGVELMFNSLSYMSLSTQPVAKPVKVMMGLIFAFIKKSIKEIPNAFASPEDLAQKRKKSLTQMWTEIAFNTPTGAIGDLVKSLTNDFRISVPVTVFLKLLITATAKDMGKAAVAPAPVRRGPWIKDSAVLGSVRAMMHHTRSTPLMDSAQPVEDFVTKFAMRPITCR